MNFTIDSSRISIDQIETLVNTPDATISPSETTLSTVRESRNLVEEILQNEEPVYGLNTGLGKLAQTKISPDKRQKLQKNVLKSHATGTGSPLSPETSRLILLLKIHEYSLGYSGISTDLFQRLARIFNAGFAPVIPEQGSVGASGDLAPLAHMGRAITGKGELFRPQSSPPGKTSWEKVPATIGLKKAGLSPQYSLKAKEGLSLVNGTQVSLGILLEAALKARQLMKIGVIASTLSLDARKCSIDPFQKSVYQAKNNSYQKMISDQVTTLMEGSNILQAHEDCDKVQDPYAFRCIPQVHAASMEAYDHVETIIEREINASTDNPLIDAKHNSILSAGNFHGQSLALAADYLASAISEIANISERRTENLVNPDLGDLPPFLTEYSGENSGLMMYQVVAASLVSENKTYAHPASVDSIPTSGNQEDHVSMATFAARKLRDIVDNVEKVLGIELLCATQALEFHEESTSPKLQNAYNIIRDEIPPLLEDRPLQKDLEDIQHIMNDPNFLRIVPEIDHT